ncbi:TIGR02449 family protein [Endothiovibrio diazotrophicus]
MEELLLVCDQLNAENRSLRERQDALVAERAVLIEKNEMARTRVEAMINRLKAMEQGG